MMGTAGQPKGHAMATFKENRAGMDKLRRDLAKQLSAGIKIPAGGSEADAVAAVKNQMKGMGITPNDAEVRKLVQEARN